MDKTLYAFEYCSRPRDDTENLQGLSEGKTLINWHYSWKIQTAIWQSKAILLEDLIKKSQGLSYKEIVFFKDAVMYSMGFYKHCLRARQVSFCNKYAWSVTGGRWIWKIRVLKTGANFSTLVINSIKTLLGVTTVLLRRYSPLCALAFLMSLLHRYLPRPFFHHTFTSKVLTSLNTECSHLNLGLCFFLLPSGLKKVILLQCALPSILAICPSHLNLAILIMFTILAVCISYTVHHYTLFSIPQWHNLDRKFFLNSFFQAC